MSTLKLLKLPYGTHETPIDLSVFLYRGGAATRKDLFLHSIEQGYLGDPIESRRRLVDKFYEILEGDVEKGLSRDTVVNRFSALRSFYKWCDKNNKEVIFSSVEENFISWTEALLHRVKTKRDIQANTAYQHASHVDIMASKALNIKLGLLRKTRLSAPERKKRVLSTKADKQNLEQTFEFGQVLLDITDALPVEVIYGSLPVKIPLRNGQVLTEWSQLQPPENVKGLSEDAYACIREEHLAFRAAWVSDKSLRTRFPLINLRVEAELLIFISQTGMNLSQAFQLKRGKFRYQSDNDEIKAFRAYKGRRQGEVEFRAFKEYLKLFKRYLNWVEAVFPAEETRLFPFVYPYAIPRTGKAPNFQAVLLRCKRLGIRHFKPQALRNTRVNWLLRRSRDPSLTAEMAQHTKETLISVYEKPHHQVSASEISRFHRMTDPSLESAGPGLCINTNHNPLAVTYLPESAPSPDCVNPAGCLFCDFHRDVDSADYIWSLATYRYCKRLELDHYMPSNSNTSTELHPAAVVINRISEKLISFEASSEIRAAWGQEAKNRIREGRFHPAFDGLIQLMEQQP